MDALNYGTRRRQFHLRQAGSRRQIQAQHPLRRVEVVAEIVDGRHLSEDGADLCNTAKGGLRLGFAVLDEAVDHAGECSKSSALATSKGSEEVIRAPSATTSAGPAPPADRSAARRSAPAPRRAGQGLAGDRCRLGRDGGIDCPGADFS